MGHHQLDSLDEQILRLIASNARIPFLEVARACNVSGAAIHQRIQKLTNLGILKGSEYVIDPEKIGYETCAYIGLYLKDPEQFDSVTAVSYTHLHNEKVICNSCSDGSPYFRISSACYGSRRSSGSNRTDY